MSTSQNGYKAGDRDEIGIETATVPGTPVQLPIRKGDVTAVLLYVAERFHKEVQPLRAGWCWGYAYRPVRGQTTTLSNHASGTAIDLNAPNFPRGVRTSSCMTAKQIAACRKIVRDCDGVIRWGGDYHTTPDAMHFEIDANVTRLAALARKIESEKQPAPRDVKKAVYRAVGATVTPVPSDYLVARRKCRRNPLKHRTMIRNVRRALGLSTLLPIWNSAIDRAAEKVGFPRA